MKEYELLDHTADAKFRAFGSTREEAFANAVKGAVAIVMPPESIVKEETRAISVAAKRLDSLLFDMLDAILFLIDTEHFIPACAEDLAITEHEGKFSLDAVLKGQRMRRIPGNLKAVTYSDMICAQQPDGTWLIQVVIDI